MPTFEKSVARCRVKPGAEVRLKDFDSKWGGSQSFSKEEGKKIAEDYLAECLQELQAQQEVLYASQTWSILIVLQGMDTSGKDSLIRHVMSGINPQGCHVTSFKHPSSQELSHNFLWRYSHGLPARGMIGVYNRSYYEEVLILRVHPSILKAQNIPKAPKKNDVWEDRFQDINHFERHLNRNGTLILKFFLHLSKEEQRERLLERINDPSKHWKFSEDDLTERALWSDYISAYEEAITATNTEYAPWHIIPADSKWFSRALVAGTVRNAIASLNLKYPELSPEQQKQLLSAKKKLQKK
ncbi:MAG: polyphosphate kinase 2 family protein [Bdellovibrionales bacterium]|nr:polyphosphate kinase 2 family protein [Bdellovibrionales bacterium]